MTKIDPRATGQIADRDLMCAVVAGCAIISNADGWVVRDERRRMSGMIRAIDSIAAFGREEVLFSRSSMRASRPVRAKPNNTRILW